MSPQSVTVTAARRQTAPQSRQGIFHGYYFPTIRIRARFSHSSSYCPCLSLRGTFSFFLFSLHANKIFDNSSHASESCYLEKRRIPWQFTKITTSSSKSFACRETLICCWVSREALQFFFLFSGSTFPRCNFLSFCSRATELGWDWQQLCYYLPSSLSAAYVRRHIITRGAATDVARDHRWTRKFHAAVAYQIIRILFTTLCMSE